MKKNNEELVISVFDENGTLIANFVKGSNGLEVAE